MRLMSDSHPCPRCGKEMHYTKTLWNYKTGQPLPPEEVYESYRCSVCSAPGFGHIIEERVG